jgi:glycosyltransferase involved in cell wall biosynthesis
LFWKIEQGFMQGIERDQLDIKMMEQVAYFTFSPTRSALEEYRVYGPLGHAGIQIREGIIQGEPDLSAVDQSDLVLIQRDFANHFPAYQAVTRRARMYKKPVVLDLDDDLLSLPPDHPDRVATYYASRLPAILHAIIQADALTVTTRPLMEAVRELNPNVWLLPNYLDETLWNFRQIKDTPAGEPLTVLYMGSTTHQPDADSVTGPLLKIAQKYGKQVNFMFYGISPPAELGKFGQVSYQPVLTYNYQDFVRLMTSIQADVCIAPLRDNSFNRSKSPIKFYEYTAMGIAGVYADMPPYSDVIRDGADGFLARDPEEWYQKIHLLLEDENLRKRMVQTAQESISSSALMALHGGEWQEAYNEICASPPIASIQKQAIIDALDRVIIQMEEFRSKQENTIRLLHNQTLRSTLALNRLVRLLGHERSVWQAREAALQNDLKEAKLEAVNYTLSTSWRITRPLRKITKKLRREN